MTNPNDEAFPVPAVADSSGNICYNALPGMTKREYFAAAALQAYLSMKSHPDVNLNKFNTETVIRTVVDITDLLIEELNKGKK